MTAGKNGFRAQGLLALCFVFSACCAALAVEVTSQEALEQLFNGGEPLPDEVHVNAPGDVTVSPNDEVVVSDRFTLVNDNADRAVVLSAASQHRHFRVARGGTLTLKGITLSDGAAKEGGAIRNEGVLEARFCHFTNNVASRAEASAQGGAVCNDGYCLVQDSRFDDNRVTCTQPAGGAYGAALYNAGTAVVDRVTMTSGALASSSGPACGGAVYAAGAKASLVIANTTVRGNPNAIHVADGALAALVQTTVTGNGGDAAAVTAVDSPNCVLVGCIVAGNAVDDDFSGTQIEARGTGNLRLYGSLYGPLDATGVTVDKDEAHGRNVCFKTWKPEHVFRTDEIYRADPSYGFSQECFIPNDHYELFHAIRTQETNAPFCNPFAAVGFSGDPNQGETTEDEMRVFPDYDDREGATAAMTTMNRYDQLGDDRRANLPEVEYDFEVLWNPGSVGLAVWVGQKSVSAATGLEAEFFTGNDSDYRHWYGQTLVGPDDVGAAQSGPLTTKYIPALMETYVEGSGTLTFTWKVSCGENAGGLKFMFDDQSVSPDPGETDWQTVTVDLQDESYHSLSWEYTHDPDADPGSDRAWVAQIEFEPLEPRPPKPTRYYVDYVLDEGQPAADQQECERDKVYALKPAASFSGAGSRVFDGWVSSNGKRYDDGILFFDLAELGATNTLTAVWR